MYHVPNPRNQELVLRCLPINCCTFSFRIYYIMKMIELPATQFKRGIFSATTAGNLKQKLLLKCAKDHDQN